MQTEKFIAPTMKEALAKVKQTLGEDAVILKSEKVRAGGPLNFIRNDLIEVTAISAQEATEDLQLGPDFADTLQSSVTRQQEENLPPRPRFEIALLKDEIRSLRDDLSLIGNHLKYSSLPNMPKELARCFETVKEAGIDQEWTLDMAQEALYKLGGEELS